MRKAIHRSWFELRDEVPRPAATSVSLDFEGQFTLGSHEGTLFAGQIRYDCDAQPTDCHSSFAIYENWAAPIVTLVIGGEVLTGTGAAVYDSVFDGYESYYDFVNLYGSCAFRGIEDMAHVEVFFADDNAAAFDGTNLPSADQLRALPVKYVSFGTNERGNIVSRGDFRLVNAERNGGLTGSAGLRRGH